MNRKEANEFYQRWGFYPVAGGEGDDDKDKDKDKGETVSKGDFDKVSGEKDKLQKDVDDVRSEIFTPEYMAFLDAKDKPKDEDKDKDKGDVITDDQFEKMSKKEILSLATKNAIEAITKTIDADKSTRKNQSDAAREREIRRFADTHSDYEKFRPAMYGIALKPENKDMGLQGLYDKAKEYVKSLQEEPSEEEKNKQRSMGGMKPDKSTGSYTFDKKVDADTAANEAAEETSEKLGPIPSA